MTKLDQTDAAMSTACGAPATKQESHHTCAPGPGVLLIQWRPRSGGEWFLYGRVFPEVLLGNSLRASLGALRAWRGMRREHHEYRVVRYTPGEIVRTDRGGNE